MQNEELVRIEQLAACPEVKPLNLRQLRVLWHDRKIPGYRIGHRTVLFSPSKVRAALEKFEVKAIGQK